jgi:nuclear pore complex protein Nup85
MPVDEAYLEDLVQSALLSGNPEQALLYASRLDPWLAAHLADVMEPLSLLESDASTPWVESSLSQ